VPRVLRQPFHHIRPSFGVHFVKLKKIINHQSKALAASEKRTLLVLQAALETLECRITRPGQIGQSGAAGVKKCRVAAMASLNLAVVY
jgi:hypothetical protein